MVTAMHMPIRRAVVVDRQASLKRCVMKKLLTVIALISLLTIPALESANAALVSPSSPAFGDNGY
jgi:hypothetical protein